MPEGVDPQYVGDHLHNKQSVIDKEAKRSRSDVGKCVQADGIIITMGQTSATGISYSRAHSLATTSGWESRARGTGFRA